MPVAKSHGTATKSKSNSAKKSSTAKKPIAKFDKVDALSRKKK